MNRTRFALPVVLVALFATAGTASAAPKWHTAQPISSPNSSNLTPDVAVNARGDSAAIWLSKPATIRVATRAAGGDWGATAALPTAVGATPRVAIDGSGQANILWTSSSGSTDHLWTAEYGSGGLTPAVELDKASPGGYAAIAANEQGDAVAAWVGYNAAGATLRAFVRPAGGAWSGPKQISATRDFPEQVHVAIDSQGRAVVVWRSGMGSIEASFYTPGSGWGKAKTIAQGDQNFGGESPRVAIDDAGRATVVWTWGGLASPFWMVK